MSQGNGGMEGKSENRVLKVRQVKSRGPIFKCPEGIFKKGDGGSDYRTLPRKKRDMVME